MSEANRSGGSAAPAVQVDHVSIAVPRIDEALQFFQKHFPIVMGVPASPGYVSDFNWCDFYIGRFKLELIEPAGSGGGFVERFLSKRGPGLHHWSLETTALAPLVDRMEREGVRIVDRFDAGNGDATAFVSPRSAFGVLIQFWQVPRLHDLEHPKIVTYRLPNGESVRMRVDHVSIAVRDMEVTLDFFRRHIPFQLRRPPHPGWDGTFLVGSFYVNDYKVELIQPTPGKSGFASRFIERRGEGFHHVSIDVDRLDPYVEQLERDGVRVVDKQTLRNGQKTAFISPRSAFGVLIQLWQAHDFRS